MFIRLYQIDAESESLWFQAKTWRRRHFGGHSFFGPSFHDLLHKTNLPTSLTAKALHLHSAPAPTLPLHIPCFSMVFLLLLLLSLVFMCSQSHSAAPFYLFPIPFLSFASLLGWLTLCDHGKTPLQGLQCRICHRTGNWLLSYRTTPLQFVKDF